MVKKGELLSVFSIGAAGYSLLEILWRGNTHWTMTLAGGICFVGIHLAIIVNLWMHWHVWDYSSQWMNFLGQVCPLFSFFWFVLTFPLLFLSNQINRFFQSHSLELKLR